MQDVDEEPGPDGANNVPIANFKSNKLSQINKKQKQEEVEKLKMDPSYDMPGSPTRFESIRLPNTITTGS
jgi:hypothetical protein